MKQGQRAEINTFIQGLITEASPLNFPPNASKQEENFELFRDGTRRRRKGMDFIDPTLLLATNESIDNAPFSAYNTFVWESVNGQEDFEIVVVQVGQRIYFFDKANMGTEDSADLLGYLDLPVLRTDRMSFANIDGRLVVAGKTSEIYLITTEGVGSLFDMETIRLKVRDFWGIEVSDDTQVEDDPLYQPPSPPSTKHLYNLLNQSWGIKRRDAGGIGDPISTYYSTYNLYPSNSEVVWTGLQYQPVEAGADPYERIYPNLYKELFGLNFIAPKGFFVIDLLDRGSSRVTEVLKNKDRPTGADNLSTFTTVADQTSGGISVVSDFAGRIFYSGFTGKVVDGDKRSPSLNNCVAFSQLIKGPKDFNKCYQEGDPTSREGSDIVDTDGGLIKIAGASNIIGLRNIGNHLVVFADNGIWSITGGSDYGFTATNYRVDQVSTFGCSSPSSIVEQGETVAYWGDGGIYVVARGQGDVLGVSNITQTTIQTLYDNIPESARDTAYGLYEEVSKKTRWIYKEGIPFTNSSVTFELIFDLSIGNISMNRISNLPSYDVEVFAPFETASGTYYVTLVKAGGPTYSLSYSIYSEPTFTDWKSWNGVGVDAKALLLTGAQIAGDSAIHKQIPYLVIHMNRTETGTDSEGVPINSSSCLFRTYWDWAHSEASNKVGQFQQAYRYRKPFNGGVNATSYDNGFEVLTTKSKVRGRGRSFALYMETEPKKDCHILGWNLTINGDSVA